MLLLATTINYMDRQVLSLTWKDFIAPEFEWTDAHYGVVTAVFSLVYAVANLFSGRFVDWIGTKRGYAWAIAIWSLGACLHAACSFCTGALMNVLGAGVSIATVSMCFFIAARVVLAVGESGNFPAAIKATAEHFPPKDRAFATSVFNTGATVGALVSPLSIPLIAARLGWQAAFIVIGALGFVWLGGWLLFYRPAETENVKSEKESVPLSHIASSPEAWGIFVARLLTDGVWWFLLFWTPAYLSSVYNLSSDSPQAVALLTLLYALTLLSIPGAKMPQAFLRPGGSTFGARMQGLAALAAVPLLAVAVPSLGARSVWLASCVVGLLGASHQAWSANVYTVCSDLFPPAAVATLAGVCGLAGGLSAFGLNLASGALFAFAQRTGLTFLGFEGLQAGYAIVFVYCAVAYPLGWLLLRSLTRHRL